MSLGRFLFFLFTSARHGTWQQRFSAARLLPRRGLLPSAPRDSAKLPGICLVLFWFWHVFGFGLGFDICLVLGLGSSKCWYVHSTDQLSVRVWQGWRRHQVTIAVVGFAIEGSPEHQGVYRGIAYQAYFGCFCLRMCWMLFFVF